MYTSARSPTAPTIAGSCSSGVGARSSCRPPWFEMTIASAPASTTTRASSTVWMPLMTIGPFHASRSQPRSASVIVGSKTRLIRSATVPCVSAKTANRSGSVVSLSNHQPGWSPMSTSVRTRQGRRDREAVVDVAQPGAGDRRVDGQDERGEAGGVRPANEVEPRVSVVPQVELEPAVGAGRGACHVLGRRRAERRERIRDAQLPATRATAGSPSWCISRVKPVGAKTRGRADGRPRIVVEVSTCDTSCRTLGTNSTRAKASRERRRLVSLSAAPST